MFIKRTEILRRSAAQKSFPSSRLAKIALGINDLTTFSASGISLGLISWQDIFVSLSLLKEKRVEFNFFPPSISLIFFATDGDITTSPGLASLPAMLT